MRRLTWILFPIVLSACASQDTAADGPTTTMLAIATELMDRAESRADVGRMVVSVHGVDETGFDGDDANRVIYYGQPSAASIGGELERELLLSLSDQVRILEPDWSGLDSETSGLEQALKETNATHLVVGEFVRRGDKLRVSVRLIDVDTGLIIATARGYVHVDELSDRARRAALDLPAASGPGPRFEPPVFVASSAGQEPSAAREEPSLANSSSPAVQTAAADPASVEPAPRGPAQRRAAARSLPPRTGPAFFRWSARGAARRR